MRVEEGKYSIAELAHWFKSRDLVVNNDYQRGARLWPPAAKSYFIDTIIKDFPFPKVYFYERLDKETKRPRREIVDGQQRITTIVEFMDGKFSLGKNAMGLEGKKYTHLTEEQQEAFLSYTVSVDVIRNADRSEILQMFRRMNAFTLPLNAAEKRHCEFFGSFKDWVNTVLDKFDSLIVEWGILTSRQVMRMGDAELVADLALAIKEGIVSTSPPKLLSLYKENDTDFPERDLMDERIRGAIEVIITDFSELRSTYMTRPHIFHSLVCALIHNKFGLVGAEAQIGCASTGNYYSERDIALSSLKRLAVAHEEKDSGEYREYVQAASEGGNRANQRGTRIKWICRALQGKLA
jgi:hypothetical protein